MNLSELTNSKEFNNNLSSILPYLAKEIKLSYLKDCDKTDAMKTINNFLCNILKKNESLEEALNQNEELFQYFMTNFIYEVLSNILFQPIVYGQNGDDIALDLLINIYKLFLKYHQNIKYSPLFERIREIVNTEKSNYQFFTPPNELRYQPSNIDNPKKKYNYYYFNHEFCSDFIDKSKEEKNIFKQGENVDVLIKYKKSKNLLDKNSWIRAKIKSVNKEDFNYIIESPELDSDLTVQIGSNIVVPEGTKTKDWEWRKNLKKYDLIDCYDRKTWYPATICNVEEETLSNGYKTIIYKIGFRLYPKYFKNKNDENDKYENYKCFWKFHKLELDENNEEYYGDKKDYDEPICFYSKRIQKFQSYTNIQKDFLSLTSQSVSRNKSNDNKIQKMNYELENDGKTNEINDDLLFYEKNGKKNYIIGKNESFSYYYALFLKKLADENVFEEFIKIINNNPNSEELYTILYTLYYALPYLHNQYLIENLNNFRNGILNFIDNLNTNDIRNLSRNLIEMIIKFLKKLSNILKLDENDNCECDQNKKNEILIFDEITIRISIKMLKTSIFDKRMQGIKTLNEYINENKQKSNAMKILIELIHKNEIIKEIFGANYHSQIISKSDKIIDLLLENNEIKEEDIKLIWDCTQRGDLEAKTTIMKLLSDLAINLNENFINIILQNIINKFDKNKINENEIDFIYNLSIHGNNENNKIKCCEYLYQCILKLDLFGNIQRNPIMEKLISLTGKDNKYLNKILSLCEKDLKLNNSSLFIFQILSAIFNKNIVINLQIMFLNDNLKDFINDDDKLLILYKNNFDNYIQKIKEVIKNNNNSCSKMEKQSEQNIIENYDDVMLDNYSHAINIQKRIEFLKKWIITLYPSFDFVSYLKEILLDKPVSINDRVVFYEFMQNYISSTKRKDSKEKKERKENIRNQLFKIFIENNQSNMTMSEFKLFIVLFFKINNLYITYKEDKDDNFEINLKCDNIEQIQQMDKLWNVIFQIKDEKVLNKAINIIYNIYKGKDQIDKLLKKCNDLIKDDTTGTEIVEKCLKLLRIIIIESEKNKIIKTKSHLNLIKNCLIYLPLKLTVKNNTFYSNNDDKEENNDNTCEIFYGNTTINEIKEILIRKGKIPLKNIEVSLSKEYMNKLKNNDNKNKEENNKENNDYENEKLLDDIYTNKSILEIINYNYNIDLLPNEIFIFSKSNIEKANILEGNEFNSKYTKILKEQFNELTKNIGNMDLKGCLKYISKATKDKSITENEENIKSFFRGSNNLGGYISEEKSLKNYLNSLNNRKQQTGLDHLKPIKVKDDLIKKDEPEQITYINNNKLPRFSLGNDKLFIETLFNLFDKLPNKKDIFEFLFFLSTNKEIYNNILYNINKLDEKNFEKIFEEKTNVLEQLYTLTIIESIFQDISACIINISKLFNNCKKKDNKNECSNVLKSKYYEYFDEIDINKKKYFLKEFIINKNYEKLLKYIDKLLVEFKFDANENDNQLLDMCLEKSMKLINIIINACSNTENNKEKSNLDENILNNKGILLLDCNNLSIIIKKDNKIKEIISQMSFLELATNLIKFITNINNYLNSNTSLIIKNNNNKLLKNSFNLLIKLISYNNKLLIELDSKKEINDLLSSLIKDVLTCKNEYYKSFYIKCLITSIKNSSNKNKDNKYLNLLFKIANNIFNEMMVEKPIDESNSNTSESSILFFDFFILLSSSQTDNEDNELLFKIYNILFDNLEKKENEKKISNVLFIGLMNILIKGIKNNENLKNIIINKEIEGKTLIQIIMEKIYKNEENDDKNELITDNINADEEKSKFINLDSIKQDIIPKKSGLNKEIIDICNEYLKECFKFSKDSKIIEEIASILKILNEKTNINGNGENKSSSLYCTKNYNHIGLKNIGCICYMNSIMQQIYMVPTFRYAIMGSDDKESPNNSESGMISLNDDNLLHQLQIMYTYLTYSEKEDYNPKYFCYSYKDFDGNPTNPMIQQDSQEFYNNFCDKIENCLKKTKYKYIINDVFTGRTCSSVICESCKNVSNRFEDFYNLTLEVKNITNLNDSLQKMIMPEKIDDFKCDACNQKVTISKRTSLCDLPNVLVIQLKRFYMNYEIERTQKINSKFEFPLNINLKEFCIENIVTQISGKKFESNDIYVKEDEYYNYILKGINIHLGSADGGHYFSLINIERDGKGNILLNTENDENNKDGKNYKWLKFNDSHISIFDINDIEKECFGGASKRSGYHSENFQNAYMLIYERKKKNPIRILYDENEIKQMNIKNNENIIKINKDNKQQIKKKYDLNRNKSDIDEKSLYNKLFIDEEKGEYYKYIPYYNIDKYAPRNIYNQVMEKNKKIIKMKNNNEKADNKNKNDFYEILLDIVSLNDFNILSDKYKLEIKKDLITLFLENIFTSISNKYHSNEERAIINSKAGIILDKIILPFINPILDNLEKKEISETEENKFSDNYLYSLIISSTLIQREKLEKIYINDITEVFDNTNVELFSKVIKGLILINYQKNPKNYLLIIEELFNALENINSTSTYSTTTNIEINKTPLYYVYEMLYRAALQDIKTTEKLINKNAISTLLGKLGKENELNRNLIYDTVTHLIKNVEEYNDKLFDIKENKKKSKNYFHEKNYLIRSITSSIVELLFDERLELVIILIKMLQYDEYRFSMEFNNENLFLLYEYSIKKNKFKDMIKILYAILEINDKYTFDRVNSILGYPTMIIKHAKNNNINTNGNNNDIFEEKKEAEDKNENNKNKKNYYWPLFGERLIMEEKDRNNNKNNMKLKLRKHIFKYIGIRHKYEKYCLLSLLFPEEDDKKENGNKSKELIDENERIKLIYDLLKLILIGRGNYCLFKYIYLLPARSLYYKNLYEEMIDILEEKNNKKLYDLREIKKNADICIKRINFEVDKTIKELKYIDYDKYKKTGEYILPEIMKKYYIDNYKVENFIGINPNMIPSDIFSEEIKIIASGTNMYLIRLKYFTKYKTPEEIRNNLTNKIEMSNITGKEKNDNIKIKENKKEERNKKNEDKKRQSSQNQDLGEEEEEEDDEENNEEELYSDEEDSEKMDISIFNNELDGKEFMFKIIEKLQRTKKIIIEDSSIENKENIKPSLIRFIILSTQDSESDIHIRISKNNIPNEINLNYYYPDFFIDNIKEKNISNFMNIFRIRNDLRFLGTKHIGINIDVKN